MDTVEIKTTVHPDQLWAFYWLQDKRTSWIKEVTEKFQFYRLAWTFEVEDLLDTHQQAELIIHIVIAVLMIGREPVAAKE